MFQINDPPLCSLTDWLLGCFQVTFNFEQLQPINPFVILPDNQTSLVHFSVVFGNHRRFWESMTVLDFFSDSLAVISFNFTFLLVMVSLICLSGVYRYTKFTTSWFLFKVTVRLNFCTVREKWTTLNYLTVYIVIVNLWTSADKKKSIKWLIGLIKQKWIMQK